MINLVEIALRVREDGTIAIPIADMEQMKIHTGDMIQLIYMAESEDNLVNESKEFLLTRTGWDEVSFQIPVELLKDAGIPLEADLDIVCRDGQIIILPSGDAAEENVIPKELLGIFEELGIAKDKVQIILRTEKGEMDGQTDL